MNERIRELLVKAIKEVGPDDADRGAKEKTLEKFAELIVKEMCGMIEQCQYDCDTGIDAETNWGYISQLQDWIDRFKEHFGVE